MEDNNQRRSFLNNITIGSVGAAVAPTSLLRAKEAEHFNAEKDNKEIDDNSEKIVKKRKYNTAYKN